MSIEAFGAILKCRLYDGAQINTLLALGDLCDPEDQTCWPSLAYLAAVARLTVRSVQRALDVLEADGVVVVKARNAGRGRSNRYWLDVKRFHRAMTAMQAARDAAFRRTGGNADVAEAEALAAAAAAFGPVPSGLAIRKTGKKKGDTESRQGPKKGDAMSPFPKKNTTQSHGFRAEHDTMSKPYDTESKPSLDTESTNTPRNNNNTDSQDTIPGGVRESDRRADSGADAPGAPGSTSPRPLSAPRSLTHPERDRLAERLGGRASAAYIADCAFDGCTLIAANRWAAERLREDAFAIRQALGEHVQISWRARPGTAAAGAHGPP